MKTLIISHANCVDGFVSAYLMNIVYPNNEIIFAKYQESLDYDTIFKEKWERICIVDFNLDQNDIDKLLEQTDNIEQVDHHDTAIKIWGDGDSASFYLGGKIVERCMCGDYCAAKLIWDKYFKAPYNNHPTAVQDPFFIPDYVEELGNYDYANLRTLVNYVDDYDRWVLEFPVVFEINEIIRQILEQKDTALFDKFNTLKVFVSEINRYLHQPYNYDEIEDLYRGELNLQNLIYNTIKIVKDRDAAVNHLTNNPQIFNFQGYEVPFISCQSNLVNYVGNALADQYPFVFMYDIIPTKQKVKISLRSKKFGPVNVAELAQIYGGGGHPSAAGFNIDLNTFNTIIQNGVDDKTQ